MKGGIYKKDRTYLYLDLFYFVFNDIVMNYAWEAQSQKLNDSIFMRRCLDGRIINSIGMEYASLS